MGGGPSDTQKQASAQELANSKKEGKLADASAVKFNSLYGQTNPFYTDEMNKGLPFYDNLTDYDSGLTARAFAPAKADFLRRTSNLGGLPSGFRASGVADINESRAHAFDDSLKQAEFQNFATKQAGAAGNTGLMQIVNPAAFYGGSTSAASGATHPLQAAPNPWMGVLGGAVQGASSAIPF